MCTVWAFPRQFDSAAFELIFQIKCFYSLTV
jgi:hypothetical protein